MQIKSISPLLVAAALSFSHAAFAADGTISFSGSVTAQTCTIKGNGSGANNFTVTLPTVQTRALTSAGQYAGRTPFNITLSDCTPKSGKVRAYFEPGPTVDLATGNLAISTGGATNVQINLLNDDLTPIKLGVADASQNSKSVNISEAGAATLSFYAQYMATGAATAGAANSSVMYSLIYQ